MPIQYSFASCLDKAGDGAPDIELIGSGMGKEAVGNNIKEMSNGELDETIQRYKKLIQSDLKLNKTKLQVRLKALQDEKAARSRVEKTKRLKDIHQVLDKRPETPQQHVNSEPKNGTTYSSTKIVKDQGFGLLPIFSFTRKKRPFADCLEIVKEVSTPESHPPKSDGSGAKALTVGSRTRKARRAAALAGGTPDSAVVLFSSDDESLDDREMTPLSAGPRTDCPSRRISSRISQQRKLDQNFRIAFPSRGDPDAVEVYYRDLHHLKPAEFLNDTVIDFYIKYLQHQEFRDSERLSRFYFYNTFFFKKVIEATDIEETQKQNEALSKLRKWTKGVDIFGKSYLIIPVNDKFHWSLVIVGFSICEDNNRIAPYFYHLDSLESGHPTRSIIRCLRRYLALEYEHHRGSCVRIEWSEVITKRVEVPRQDNEYDCGLFLLCYIKRFIMEAPLPCKLTNATLFGRRWFRPMEASGMRGVIKELLLKLFDDASS